VTGIRKDRWANAHRIPVEQDKPAADQGRYLHPDLYDGQPLTVLAKIRNLARSPPRGAEPPDLNEGPPGRGSGWLRCPRGV
jgi:hypothetical protein